MIELYNRFTSFYTGKSFLLSSFTRYYWIKLSLIVQDSPLLALSLGLVSVPVWLTVLSDQLRIIGFLGFYPTNYLILQKLIQKQFYTWLVMVSQSWDCRYKIFFLYEIRLSQTKGKILLLYSPVRYASSNAFNSHVLSIPQAFTLSQDQTHII